MQLELGKTFRTDSTPVRPRETDLSENSPDFSFNTLYPALRVIFKEDFNRTASLYTAVLEGTAK